MGSLADVKRFPLPLFAYFPNNNTNYKSHPPLCSKIVLPRISSLHIVPLQALPIHKQIETEEYANDLYTHQKKSARDEDAGEDDDEDEDEDVEDDDDEEEDVEDDDDEDDEEEDDEYEEKYRYNQNEKMKQIEMMFDGRIPHVMSTNMVWWDMDTAPLPRPEYARHLARNIRSWLCGEGYFGPVELHAFGDKNKISTKIWNELLKGNGTFTHVPSEGDVASHYYILIELGIAIADHPSANYMIISSNDHLRDFGLGFIFGWEYHTFLVQPSSSAKKVFANKKWIWEDVAGGGPSLSLFQ